jgi:hypothetical protein
MLGLGKEVEHAKLFCQNSCEDCAYYRRVKGLKINVLVVSQDEDLIRHLAGEESEDLSLRFVHNGYEASPVTHSRGTENLLLRGSESLGIGHQSEAHGGGPASECGPVSQIALLLEVRGSPVNPSLPLGEKPVDQAGQTARHGLYRLEAAQPRPQLTGLGAEITIAVE